MTRIGDEAVKKWLSIIIISLILAIQTPFQAIAASPYISARAYCLVDLQTGQVLHGSSHRKSMPPASTTKVMTALLALEYLDLNEWARVSPRAAKTPPSSIGLKAGQEMKVGDLLTAALLCSANDATVVLAEKIAGSEEVFAYLMNKKAFLLGATSTHFKNSNGLPAQGHTSTCLDLVIISRAALQHDFFAQTVAKTKENISHPGYPQGKSISNTNRLLAIYPGSLGIKTGTTDAAGKCLVGLAEKEGRKLVTVVLKSGDRYRDSVALLDYGFKNFKQDQIILKENPFKTLRVKDGKSMKIAVQADRDIWVWLPSDGLSRIEKKVKLDYNPCAPIKRGDKLGIIEVYYNEELVSSARLVSNREVEKKPRGIWRLFRWRAE